MKIAYDAEVDALSIFFRETTVTSKNLGEGIAVDYDSEGKLAGVEILNVAERFGGHEPLRRVVFEGIGVSTEEPIPAVAETRENYSVGNDP